MLHAFVVDQGWALRRLATSPAVVGPQLWGPAPREAEALLLLTDRSEVATTMGISAHTLHSWVKTIHARLGVRSRVELMARSAEGAAPDPEELPRAPTVAFTALVGRSWRQLAGPALTEAGTRSTPALALCSSSRQARSQRMA